MEYFHQDSAVLTKGQGAGPAQSLKTNFSSFQVHFCANETSFHSLSFKTKVEPSGSKYLALSLTNCVTLNAFCFNTVG